MSKCEYKHELNLCGHSASINSVRFNADGNYCMTCSDDRTLRLWNPHKTIPGQTSEALLIKTYSGVHGYSVSDVAISRDNCKFASCGADRICFYWDVGTGRVIRRLQGHVHRINAVNMNTDSTVLLSASYDQTVRLWDLRSNSYDPIQILDDFKDSVTSVQTTSYEIICGCVDGKIRVFDLRAGRMHADDCVEPVTYCALTNDSKCVLSTCLGGVLRMTELSSGRLLQIYEG